ncbi:glycine oxidase ThiO [Mesorhizobium sp. NBSH29]|uniref:glycine oxidase ThiO n=1 Tax=Mesorhizobium sp. NBSH29 TaxID=2654249 RepID=UPI00189672A8|nr:glycine oxidase ThiO [Mesorhizobium sp. NBSH29]QPC88301.1 glycine oxidase ThiO [Mesorhizobium sp. NBSH29]
MKALIRGAGVAGLATAWELTARGIEVSLVAKPGGHCASWFAGGMLAPYCESESAGHDLVALAGGAIGWWQATLPGHVCTTGTLVVTPARDRAELDRFAARTEGFERCDAERIAALEPALEGRFSCGLLFHREAHLDPRLALSELRQRCADAGVTFHDIEPDNQNFDHIIDCTGMARTAADKLLRGVRGEMLILRARDICLSRPVRLLHPRFPLYIVPRADHCFMVGATMIETDHDGPATARSVMELLNATYALHPAFAEAELLETGAGVRPAYPDNLPRVTQAGSEFALNGLYRHGFLLAPAMAQRVAQLVTGARQEKAA